MFVKIFSCDWKQQGVYTFKNTSQQFAVFFHKFGLVRLSFDPGVMTPGFSFYIIQALQPNGQFYTHHIHPKKVE